MDQLILYRRGLSPPDIGQLAWRTSSHPPIQDLSWRKQFSIVSSTAAFHGPLERLPLLQDRNPSGRVSEVHCMNTLTDSESCLLFRVDPFCQPFRNSRIWDISNEILWFSTPVCRSHRAGACRPPPRSCVCASVFFREKRQQSNEGRAAHLAILNCSIGKKHRALQAGSGLLKFKGGGTGLTWIGSKFWTESRRSVSFDTSTKPATPVSWGVSAMGRRR